MKQLFLFISFSILSTVISSQKPVSLTPEIQWAVHTSETNGSTSVSHAAMNPLFVLSMNEKEKVIPIDLDKGQYGVAKVDTNGKVIWQATIEGLIKGIGKFGDNVIAISRDADPYKDNSIMATLLDSRTGKQVQKKTIFQNSTDNRLEIKVQNNADGVFSSVFVRTRDVKAKVRFVGGPSLENQLTSINMEAVFLSPDLTAKTITLKSSVSNGIFCCAATNKSGNIVIVSADKDNLYALEFAPDGIEKSKLISPFEHNGYDISCISKVDEVKDNAVIAAVRYYRSKNSTAFKVYNFDFGTKKVQASQEQELDKGYAKTLELEQPKGVPDGGLRQIEDMLPGEIIQWGDKIALVQNITSAAGSATSSSTTRFYNLAWVINIFNRDLTISKNIGVDKKYESFIKGGMSIGMHLKGEHLYVVYPVLSGIGSYATLMSDVNLNAEKVESTVKIDRQGISSGRPIEANNTLWFDNTFLLSYLIPSMKVFSENPAHCQLQKVEY